MALRWSQVQGLAAPPSPSYLSTLDSALLANGMMMENAGLQPPVCFLKCIYPSRPARNSSKGMLDHMQDHSWQAPTGMRIPTNFCAPLQCMTCTNEQQDLKGPWEHDGKVPKQAAEQKRHGFRACANQSARAPSLSACFLLRPGCCWELCSQVEVALCACRHIMVPPFCQAVLALWLVVACLACHTLPTACTATTHPWQGMSGMSLCACQHDIKARSIW